MSDREIELQLAIIRLREEIVAKEKELKIRRAVRRLRVLGQAITSENLGKMMTA